jgi:hypothetical protein
VPENEPPAGALIGYAVIVTRPADGLHLLERFWLADAADALGAKGLATAAAGRLRKYRAPGEEVFVAEVRKLAEDG